MALVKCAKLHFYDNVKYSRCPICGDSDSVEDDSFSEGLTQFFDQEEHEDQTQYIGFEPTEEDKTIFLTDDGALENQLTVGWLVCKNGSQRGRSYTLHSGHNFAGRSIDMDLQLNSDMLICREKHFSIVYDPKAVCFFACAGTGAIFVNRELVANNIMLNDGDVITAGKSDFVFVPYCKKGRIWDEAHA